jgi:hypothetical protein
LTLVMAQRLQRSGFMLERDDDSMRPAAGPSGFASDATPIGVESVPWEKRPLSRRGVLRWTIGSMTGMVLFGTTVAVALARNASQHAAAMAPHGAETADIAPAARPEEPLASPGSTLASAALEPPVVPLSALPKAETPKLRSAAMRSSHRASSGTTKTNAAKHRSSTGVSAKPKAAAD